LNSYLELAE